MAATRCIGTALWHQAALRAGNRLIVTLALAMIAPTGALAQAGVVVQGRVVEVGGTLGVELARVELEGHGTSLTSDDGYFRFSAVTPGNYTLNVSAFGYASASQSVLVERDTMLNVALEISPFQLDSILVNARRIDVEGQVWDRNAERDFVVVDAEVLTDQVPGTLTDAHGRFELEGVIEGAPLRVAVRAFGYLPVDTIVEADEDEDYVFELEVDSVAQRIIGVQVERLEERAAGYRAIMRPMNRERLLRYAGTFTLLDVVESQYRSYLDRIWCVLIDEVQISNFGQVLAILTGLLPEEVERIEFIANQPDPPNTPPLPVFMMRVYTRGFIQEMIARDRELRPPVFLTINRRPFCR